MATTVKKTQSSEKKSGSIERQNKTVFDILKQDHDNVKDLFEELKETEKDMDSLEDLFAQLEQELKAHMQAEEEFFYPALEESDDSREQAFEAYEEHNVAKNVLEELSGTPFDDERWPAKVKVLNDLIDHHIEEEEGEMFKIAKKTLNKEQIQEITEAIQNKKEQLTAH